MRPVWNGDETEWALDSCLLGHYRCVSFPAIDCAQAQTASGDSEVSAGHRGRFAASQTSAPGQPAAGRAPRPATRNVRRVLVYPTAPTPTAGSGMDVDKVPAAINAVGAAQIARTDSLNIADALQQQVPGIIISDTTGNPFMPDVQFRGFVASPVAGTPQGLAVYQNGMRINEAFGDTVNWDLIPTAAIRSVDRRDQQPGVRPQRARRRRQRADEGWLQLSRAPKSTRWAARSGASRVRRSMASRSTIGRSTARSKACATTAIAIFRNRQFRRFYGDVGYRTDSSEFHLNFGVAKNNFGASAAVPVELLQNYWGATYTTPQTTDNRVAYANLTGKVEVTPTWTIDGSVRVRAFRQKTVDGNPTETEPCAADPALLCFNDDDVPGKRPQRSPACKSVPRQTPCWGRSIERQPVRRRPGRPCRQPIPTSCSGTTTSS